MSTAEILEQLKNLSIPERLVIIEAATQLIRDDLRTGTSRARDEQDRRLQAAAQAAKDLYEPGKELTEWTSLDSEDFLDDYVQR